VEFTTAARYITHIKANVPAQSRQSQINFKPVESMSKDDRQQAINNAIFKLFISRAGLPESLLQSPEWKDLVAIILKAGGGKHTNEPLTKPGFWKIVQLEYEALVDKVPV